MVVGAIAGAAAPAAASSRPVQFFVGLWKAVDTNVQQTSATTTYFEFLANGTWCSSYTTDPAYKCSTYEPSTAGTGNTILTASGKKSTPPWRYRWTALGGSTMELRSEIQLGPPHGWTTIAKYTLARTTVAKPTPVPAAVKNDKIPPKIMALTTSTRRDPVTQKSKTTVWCRATDNVGLKGVTIGYREPGVKAGGLTWYRNASTKDTNPKAQTWTDTFPTEKAGTYTAVCSATDLAKWSSGTNEKTFVVNPGQVKGAVTAANAAKARTYLDVLDALIAMYIGNLDTRTRTAVDTRVKKVADAELSRRWTVARKSTNLKELSYNPQDANHLFTWAIENIRRFLK